LSVSLAGTAADLATSWPVPSPTPFQPVVLHESLSRSRVASCGVITLGMVINGMASSTETEKEHVRTASPLPA
jgi:hypothetical protein